MITCAIELALKAHENKTRIGTKIPYAVHPIEVGIILAQNKMSKEVIVSGLIHDAIEQEYLTLDEAKEIFGEKVKQIVEKVYMVDKYKPGEDYVDRKKRALDYLRCEASPEFKFVTCADRLSNVKMMQDEYKIIGNKVWDRYSEGYEKRKWYYQSLIVSLSQISNYDMYKELVQRIQNLFGDIPASIFITDDMKSIEKICDIDIASQTRWLVDHMVGFLGHVIEKFSINNDKQIKSDVKVAIEEVLSAYQKQKNDKEFELSDAQWIDCIKLFYILRQFFRFNNDWIRDNIGVNYLAWYKVYDTEFRLMIK